ncbi:helix-turn-helix domain-containing protein [Streptomyces sp. NPDC058321]|uniref:helix-turn-helix domain-containing protein n=1 Tax=Streptomyces sp. NPDC058321 TaxID=3346445 RepID=UPI0036EFD3FA
MHYMMPHQLPLKTGPSSRLGLQAPAWPLRSRHSRPRPHCRPRLLRRYGWSWRQPTRRAIERATLTVSRTVSPKRSATGRNREIAAALGVSERSVERWRRQWREGPCRSVVQGAGQGVALDCHGVRRGEHVRVYGATQGAVTPPPG